MSASLKERLRCISLFSGAGGLDIGFERAAGWQGLTNGKAPTLQDIDILSGPFTSLLTLPSETRIEPRPRY